MNMDETLLLIMQIVSEEDMQFSDKVGSELQRFMHMSSWANWRLSRMAVQIEQHPLSKKKKTQINNLVEDKTKSKKQKEIPH